MEQQQFSNQSTASTTESTKASLGDRTREFTAHAQQKAGEQVKSGVDSGRGKAAGTLLGVADSLLNGSGERPDGASRYIRQAGEQAQRAAEWLEHADVDEITSRAEEFARKQPALFIGGAFALGLIAARFIKSSRRPRLADRHSDERWEGETIRSPFRGGESSAGWSDSEGVPRDR